jgi:acetyl esterase/lipase
MNKLFCLTCIGLFLMSSALCAQTPSNQPAAQPLWPNGAPGAKGTQPLDVPSYQFYPAPADKATGAAIVVCPGGGYRNLAAHEGHDIAVWLNNLGVTAFVLKYRLGPNYQHPAMMHDVQRAIRTVRAKAAEFKVDANRIGVMGFSAGGHLASTAATHFDAGNAQAADPIDRVSSRPDVAILCYPVITMTEGFTHAGSRKNLLGENPDPALVWLMSNEKQVTPQTPPTFIFHTVDDQAVPIENAMLFAEALRKNKVVHETHFYEHGRHGVGLAKDDPILRQWPVQLANWLRSKNFVK